MEAAGKGWPDGEEEKAALEALSPDFLEHSLPESEAMASAAIANWESAALRALEPGALWGFPPETALRLRRFARERLLWHRS